MDLSLSGRRVLVTGGSGDIGAAIARRLAAGGAHVLLHYHSSRDRARELAQDPVFARRGITLLQADLTCESSVEQLFTAAGSDGVHDLVCNAGYLPSQAAPLAQISLGQWQRTIDRNLTTMFLTLRGYFRQLPQAAVSDPSVVLVGSMSGVWGQPGHSDYAAAKAALTSGLLPTLKDEIVRIAPRGRVNLVAPGFIRTRMIDGKLADGQTMIRALQTASLRKIGLPSDVANTVGFLISGALSGHITGEVIRMAGGKEGRVLFEPSEIDLGKGNA